MSWYSRLKVSQSSFEYKQVRDQIRDILDRADASLPEPAASAVSRFIGHEPDSRDNYEIGGIAQYSELEDAYSGNPSEKGLLIRQQLDSAFGPVKEKLRAIIGDPAPLFRHQLPYQEGDDRNILSWTLNENFARHLLGPEGKERWRVSDKDNWNVKLFLDQSEAEEIANALNMAGEITPELASLYRLDDDGLDAPYRAERDPEFDRPPPKGEVLNQGVPLDMVVWASDRANQMEFIVRTH